jgi:hypothetical protein
MKERPIIFSAPMVRAIMSGAKTQTRRAVKVRCHSICENDDGKLWPWSEDAELAEDFWHQCPFGEPGDRLWVRETWGALPHMLGGFQRESLRYRADGEYQNERDTWRWRPSIHMPRWASRITLEITDVRVERLQDISEADAIAEGIDGAFVEGGRYWRNYSLSDAEAMCAPMLNFPTESYRTLWESINGPGSWDANPWVWVIEFKKLEQQEQA